MRSLLSLLLLAVFLPFRNGIAADTVAAGSVVPPLRHPGELPAPARALLQDVHRIVFLGDSITQGGDYVTDFECWLLAHGQHLEVLNLGLGSETATDLTPEENSAHKSRYGFGRPFVSERLERALAATHPDLVIACYGMNDGSSLPATPAGDARFAAAITRLRESALHAGAKQVILCTPPVADDARGQVGQHDQNLARYTTWLLARRADGWNVVDIHTPMRESLDRQRAHNSAFRFAKDGIHPGREGHWLMARQILTEALGATDLDRISAAENLFPANGPQIRQLVHQRMGILFGAWMSRIGHGRPGVAGGPGAKPGLPFNEAVAQAADFGRQIQAAMGQGSGAGHAR